MTSEIIYAISNSSMELYPNNTKAKFRNKLPKELSVVNRGDNSLWISFENVIMENAITNFRNNNNVVVPDMVFTSNQSDDSRVLQMSKSYFNTGKSVEQFLKSEFSMIATYFANSRTKIKMNTFLIFI